MKKEKFMSRKGKNRLNGFLGADLKTTAGYGTYFALIKAAIARDNESLGSSLWNEYIEE